MFDTHRRLLIRQQKLETGLK